jgi:hypothetical protein
MWVRMCVFLSVRCRGNIFTHFVLHEPIIAHLLFWYNSLPPKRLFRAVPKGYHLDVVGGPSTPHDPESDAGGSLSSWQGHPSW